MTTKVPPPSKRPVVNPNNLQKIREGMGMDVHSFLVHIGWIWKLSNYYRVEQGTQMPAADAVDRLCDALKMSQADVMPCWVQPRVGSRVK